MKAYSNNIIRAKTALKEADAVLVGIGAGMSASGGLNYADKELCRKWYPEYYKLGLETIADIIAEYWVTDIADLSEKQAQKYWGFWSRHIYHIRYEADICRPYKLLKTLLAEKPYYIITTNGDHQTQKTFDTENILAAQGDYAFFQTVKGSGNKIWKNEEQIMTMMKNMPNEYEIRAEDIPYSSEYGERLMPNLRCDEHFVEKEWIDNFDDYQQFINDNMDKNMLCFELGVGFNTPSIIRIPFEAMACQLPGVKLIRMNMDNAEITAQAGDKGISIKGDISRNLEKMMDLK